MITLWNKLEIFSEPELSHDPLLLISVSTSIPQYRILYSQARELANFLIEKVDFKLFATLYSSSMPPAVRIAADGIAELAKVDFYHHFNGKRDIILFSGYSSPASGEYEYAEVVLSYAKKLGIKELLSLGARWSDQPVSPYEYPVVYGFASDLDGVRWLEANGVNVLKNESAFYFANLIIGMAPLYGMRGFKLSVNHGEPTPHPKATSSFLKILSKFGIEADTSDLSRQARELDEGLRKAGVTGVGGGSEIMTEEDEQDEAAMREREGQPGSGEDIYR